MRVLFFSHYFPPEVNAPATRTHEHCRRWVKEGHDVTVITCVPNCPNGVVFKGYHNGGVQQEYIDGIRVVRVWTYLAANRGKVRRIANFISYMGSAWICSLFMRKPDIIVATSPQFFCGWAGALASIVHNVPFLLEIRDLWPASIVAVGALRSRPIISLLERAEGLLYWSADHIVTVGEGYKKELVGRGVPAGKIDVVMNGVDLEGFVPSERSQSYRARWGIGATDFVCSYVGTVGMAHGLEVVLKAARKLKRAGRKGVKWLIVGDGARRSELEKASRDEGLDDVIFTGIVPKEDVPPVLAASDACLVHLKDTDLFKTVMPSKIFEAMAMGKPIALGVGGEAQRVVTEAGAGVCFEPENSDALVQAILELSDNPAVAAEHGAMGRRYVESCLDRDKLASDLLSIAARTAKANNGVHVGGNGRGRLASASPTPAKQSANP